MNIGTLPNTQAGVDQTLEMLKKFFTAKAVPAVHCSEAIAIQLIHTMEPQTLGWCVCTCDRIIKNALSQIRSYLKEKEDAYMPLEYVVFSMAVLTRYNKFRLNFMLDSKFCSILRPAVNPPKISVLP
jgi:hypothetical protein